MNFKKIMFIFVLICIIVFLIFYYIFCNLGNNKNRNQEEIVEDIFKKLNNYEASIDVIVYSNKSENMYNMFQLVEGDNSKLIVKSPENVKDMTIELKNNKLKITNVKTNMEKIYDNYEAIFNNSLFLNSFIEDYKNNNNNSKIYEKDDEIIIEIDINNNSNTYATFKELHLNKENKWPKQLIVKDNTKKSKICIIYNDIKIK